MRRVALPVISHLTGRNAVVTTTDPRIAKWSTWVEDLMTPVTDLVWQMQVWRSWVGMLELSSDEAKTPPAFHTWVARNYRDSVIMGVRRLMADDPDIDYSLKRLLNELRADTKGTDGYEPALTREWYLGKADSQGTEVLYEAQWSLMCDETGERVSLRYVQADIDRLNNAAFGIRKWATDVLAHLKPDQERIDLPTFSYAELHDAINTLWGVQWRWRLILNTADQGYMPASPWEKNFTLPWLTDDQAAELYAARVEEQQRDEISLRQLDPM